MNSAERILNLLQWLPASEPPQDLVARTLRRANASSEAALVSMSAAMAS